MSAMNDELQNKQSTADEQIAEYAKLKNMQLTEAKRYYNMLSKFNAESNVEERRRAIETSNMTVQQKLKAHKDLDAQIANNEKRAEEATLKYRENLLQMYTNKERQQHFATAQAQERVYRDEAKRTCMERIQAILASTDDAKIAEAEIAKVKQKYHEDEMASIQRELVAKKNAEEVEKELRREQRAEKNKEIEENLQKELASINQKHDALNNVRDAGKSDTATTKNLQKFKALAGGPAAAIDQKVKETEARETAANAKKQAIQDEMKQLDPDDPKDLERLEELQKEFIEANKEAVKAGNEASAAKTAKAISDAIGSAYKSAFTQAENMLTTYQSHIDARLQGSEKSYEDATDKINSTLSTSPYVKTVDVLEKLREATDKGIVYNLEQRAFLATISDKIANTFDAFDSNLLRLIRLQQADTTAARLGMEASLTKFFNNMFQDSSYLTDAADTVAGALIEASSLMEKNRATEFEYIVQKWLGSLSSLGMDSSTINKIAEGINYIATGDVTSLANNTSLQTLFAMSASNANLEYSELLLNGLDVSSTNDLLRSMVEYLKTIAEDSENNVVRSAYSDIFDLSVSDMRAISNLTTTDIDSIHGMVMSYSNMEGELNTQLQQLSSRVSLASKLTNVYDNVVYGVASDMVNNPATWSMNKMLDFMVENGVNFNIPFINAMGFGLDLNAGVTDLLQLAVGASQATMLVSNLLSGLGSDGGRDLDTWGATEYNQRGNGFNFSSYSTLGGTTGSGYVTNSSTTDQNTSAISSATDEAEETGKITGKNQEVPEKTTDDFYKAMIGQEATSFVKIRDDTLLGAYDEPGKFLRVQDGRLNFDGDKLKVTDTTNPGSYDESGKFLRVQDARFTFNGEQLRVIDEHNPPAYNEAGKYLQVQDSRLMFSGEDLKVIDSNSLLPYDPTEQSLRVKSDGLSGLTFTGNHQLKVVDSTNGGSDITKKLGDINTFLTTSLYGTLFPSENMPTFTMTNSILDTVQDTSVGALKVVIQTDSNDTPLNVTDAQLSGISTTLTDIYNLLSTSSTEIKTVKLDADTVVDVKKDTLVNALKDALYGGEKDTISFTEVLGKLNGGSLVVKSITDTVPVKTPVGEKLSVSNLVW